MPPIVREGPIRMLTRAVLLVALAALAGCGTVRGIGEDMQGVGRAIERVAS